MTIAGERLEVAVFKPASCQIRSILIVLAGKNRDSTTYRNDSVPLAKHECSLVFAPDFPVARFPVDQYQRGGFPAVHHTAPAALYMRPLEQWTRSISNERNIPIILIGHSAGAQYLERVAAYAPGEEIMTVIMNPSTYVEPETDTPVPYGFRNWSQPAGLPDLKRYLARNIAIILGSDDTEPSPLINRIPAAVEQGRNRLERGQWAYAQAREQAEKLNVPFGWTITLVPATGHVASRMLASSEVQDAIETAIRAASSP
ncbi:alpha/beta fold hydrolase [Gluconobacter kanchanaburiensis]|uniref:Hydrolase n=1 Tax=Gluconobacter kanchanaburiensis NBRC 103587 TaxID=1307948 RepID=A0A511B651_9PROT|nr:alpha/beta fold hydrolase [Gluconobacter kanchanaburiensis]GEK95940.1 hydrolase [Gluconobacter kanchanaburiensis NBRC 103587]